MCIGKARIHCASLKINVLTSKALLKGCSKRTIRQRMVNVKKIKMQCIIQCLDTSSELFEGLLTFSNFVYIVILVYVDHNLKQKLKRF